MPDDPFTPPADCVSLPALSPESWLADDEQLRIADRVAGLLDSMATPIAHAIRTHQPDLAHEITGEDALTQVTATSVLMEAVFVHSLRVNGLGMTGLMLSRLGMMLLALQDQRGDLQPQAPDG